MPDIKRIVIKSGSGYGPAVYAYDDKLTITTNSVSYEYHPFIEAGGNPKQKWRFTSDDHGFLDCFTYIAEETEKIIHPADETMEAMICDAGTLDFRVTYSDQTVVKKIFSYDSDRFSALFDLISLLIPGCEQKPRMIWTSDDYDKVDFLELYEKNRDKENLS